MQEQKEAEEKREETVTGTTGNDKEEADDWQNECQHSEGERVYVVVWWADITLETVILCEIASLYRTCWYLKNHNSSTLTDPDWSWLILTDKIRNAPKMSISQVQLGSVRIHQGDERFWMECRLGNNVDTDRP